MHITKQADVPKAPPGRHNAGKCLYLIVSQDGRSRRWAFQFTKRSTGNPTELGLGSAELITLNSARDKAHDHRKSVARGDDPVEAKREAKREQTTFHEVVQALITAKAPGWKTQKHADTMRQLLTNHAGALASKSIKAVTKDDIEAALRPLLLRTPDQFKRTQSAISQVFDFAISHNHCETNPADWRHIKGCFHKLRHEVNHYTAMDYMQVPAFVRNLHTEQQRGDALSPYVIEFLILTACRINEVTSARWKDVDLTNKIWTVPAGMTKVNREHRVPLSDRAVALLTQQLTVKGEFVWPISNKAVYLYLTRSMGQQVTLHGFRSTFRDWSGNETNFDRVTCELALAHKAGDATELAYRRSDALAKRRALMDAWANYCEGGPEKLPIQETFSSTIWNAPDFSE